MNYIMISVQFLVVIGLGILLYKLIKLRREFKKQTDEMREHFNPNSIAELIYNDIYSNYILKCKKYDKIIINGKLHERIVNYDEPVYFIKSDILVIRKTNPEFITLESIFKSKLREEKLNRVLKK